MTRQNCQITSAKDKPLVTVTHFFSTQWSNCESTRLPPRSTLDTMSGSINWVLHNALRGFFSWYCVSSLSSKTKTWFDLIWFVVSSTLVRTYITRRHILYEVIVMPRYWRNNLFNYLRRQTHDPFPSNINNEHWQLSVTEEIRNTQKLQLHSIKLET